MNRKQKTKTKTFSLKRSNISSLATPLKLVSEETKTDLEEECNFTSRKENDLYITWGTSNEINELNGLATKFYNEDLNKLENSPMSFHSNLQAKNAFVPDTVRFHIFDKLKSQANNQLSYDELFANMFYANKKVKKSQSSPIVKQGLGVVLFIDISGFTKLGDRLKQKYKLNPKKAANLLAERITATLNFLVKVCYKHNGVVAKFAGDALICVWECDLSKFQLNEEDCIHDMKGKQIINEVRKMLNANFERAKQATREMLCSVKDVDKQLTLHGGIGVGNLAHIYLGKSKHETGRDNHYNPDGLKSYVLNGYAMESAFNFLDLATGTNEVCYNENFMPWIEAYLVQAFFCNWDNLLNFYVLSEKLAMKYESYQNLFIEYMKKDNIKIVNTISSNRKLFNLRTENFQVTPTLSEVDVDDFIPKLLKNKLQGNSIFGNEIIDGVSIMFVRLDDEQIKTQDFLSLPIFFCKTSRKLSVKEGYTKSLDYLNLTFIALANSVKKAGGEVRDIIFDDKGCVFICAFSAHDFVSHSEHRAVRAAIDIVNAHEKARIGLASGSCFVGLCGSTTRKDFIIMSDDVNFAAKMMVEANNGDILVSNSIYEKLNHSLVFQELTISGKSRLRICYRLLSFHSQNFKELSPGFYSSVSVKNNVNDTIHETYKAMENQCSKKAKALLETKLTENEIKKKLDQLSSFSILVNNRSTLEAIEHSVIRGDAIFLHGSKGSGKHTTVSELENQLHKTQPHIKVFRSTCTGWETQKSFLVIRNLLRMIVERELQVEVTADNINMKYPELEKLYPMVKESLSYSDFISILPILLPYLDINQARKIAKMSSDKHLKSLQSLITKLPKAKLKKRAISFFLSFVNNFCGNSFILSQTKNQSRLNSKAQLNKSKIDFVVPVRNDVENFISKTVNKTFERKTHYLLVFENFEDIDDCSLLALTKLCHHGIPSNLCLMFTLNRIQRISATSASGYSHKMFLSRNLRFRKLLSTSTTHTLKDIYLENFLQSSAVLLLKRALFQKLLCRQNEMSFEFLFNFITQSDVTNISVESERFLDDSLLFFFSKMKIEYATKIFTKIFIASRGHPGRMIAFLECLYVDMLNKYKLSSSSYTKVHDIDSLFNRIPLQVCGETRCRLHQLPGICTWTLKILSLLGKKFQFKMAHNICEALFLQDLPKVGIQKMKSKKNNFCINYGHDFRSLFTQALTILLRYNFLYMVKKETPRHKYLRSDKSSKGIGESEIEAKRHHKTIKNKSNRTQQHNKVMAPSNKFEIGKTRVASMYFSKTYLAFYSNVDRLVLNSLIPIKRKIQIKSYVRKLNF